jgi:DNA-directed RNA polymerase specialized sigma24 family protein
MKLVGRVRRLSYSLLQDSVEADDAAQQSLVEILQSAHNFTAPGNLEAWADTITVRTAFRCARRLNLQRSRFEDFVNPETLKSMRLR